MGIYTDHSYEGFLLCDAYMHSVVLAAERWLAGYHTPVLCLNG